MYCSTSCEGQTKFVESVWLIKKSSQVSSTILSAGKVLESAVKHSCGGVYIPQIHRIARKGFRIEAPNVLKLLHQSRPIKLDHTWTCDLPHREVWVSEPRSRPRLLSWDHLAMHAPSVITASEDVDNQVSAVAAWSWQPTYHGAGRLNWKDCSFLRHRSCREWGMLDSLHTDVTNETQAGACIFFLP